MDCQLLPHVGLGGAADVAPVLVSLAGSATLVLPACATPLSKNPSLIVPMLFWISIVISCESVRYVRALGGCFGLPLAWGGSGLPAQSHQARTGARLAFGGGTGFHKEGLATVRAQQFDLLGAACPRTKARAFSSLIDREVFAAGLTCQSNLFTKTDAPASVSYTHLTLPTN